MADDSEYEEIAGNLSPIIIQNVCGVKDIRIVNVDKNVELTVDSRPIMVYGGLHVQEHILGLKIALAERSAKSAYIVADLTVSEWSTVIDYERTRKIYTRKNICERRYDRIHKPGRCFGVGGAIKLFDYDYAYEDGYEGRKNKFIVYFTDFQITYI